MSDTLYVQPNAQVPVASSGAPESLVGEIEVAIRDHEGGVDLEWSAAGITEPHPGLYVNPGIDGPPDPGVYYVVWRYPDPQSPSDFIYAEPDTLVVGPTLDSIASGLAGLGGATGSTEFVHKVVVDGDPADGVFVWVTTDKDPQGNIVGTARTDAFGKAYFMLDPGKYFVWRQQSGVNFSNPVEVTVA